MAGTRLRHKISKPNHMLTQNENQKKTRKQKQIFRENVL